ncbi:MAG: hypothetical protein HOG03_09575 [Desulfobacula sp.]|jgi:hypothetical protein|uniref:hypothetical protein n=1 Tax=Desulfobacula sp. TaxID=2593537 RepID=UPI001D83B04C|nr:hypothetical protein [Desulfobacula sp.]MBT3485490.1 hypothetical protein [Desulfobacula sp.]MBT3804836.1 hypothetical protein [Desulfobacula sp.]MBT4026197.1 hypothetical protein [Desulfobacula sp.]MBT4199763.1 hypothetical protein [Desulfobacula sp.]
MKTHSSLRDHIKSSREKVSTWPSWKKDVMGVVSRNSRSGQFAFDRDTGSSAKNKSTNK